jgi:hypothetical protein
MKNTEYIKAFDLSFMSACYGFKQVSGWVGSMFVLNCTIWETRYQHIYITDYDFNNDEDLEKKGLCALFYGRGGRMLTITNELLKDENAFNQALEVFNYEIESFKAAESIKHLAGTLKQLKHHATPIPKSKSKYHK